MIAKSKIRKVMQWAVMTACLLLVVLAWHRWSPVHVISHLKGNQLLLSSSEGLDFKIVNVGEGKASSVEVFNSGFTGIEIIGTNQTCQCAFVKDGFLPVSLSPRQVMKIPIEFYGRGNKVGEVDERVLLITNQNSKQLPVRVRAMIRSSLIEE